MWQSDKEIIIDQLKALWPKYDWNEFVLRIWYGILSNYDFKDAKAAITLIYSNGLATFQKQLLPEFKKQLRTKVTSSEDHKCPLPLFYLECDEKSGMVPFNEPDRKNPLPDYEVAERAERIRQKFCKMYGGSWRIVGLVNNDPF